MRHGRLQETESFEIPQTPLIDIIFILIIFFLVATTFYTDERDLDINLPEGTQGNLITQEEDKYVINVRQSGVIVVRNEIKSLSELEQELRGLVARGKTSVEVRGDSNAFHGTIMQVMNLCKKVGIGEYSLTQRIVKETE